MIWESSLQARFLFPMAISLGFGVLFATFVILLLVPALYMIVEDIIRLRARIFADGRERKKKEQFIVEVLESQSGK